MSFSSNVWEYGKVALGNVISGAIVGGCTGAGAMAGASIGLLNGIKFSAISTFSEAFAQDHYGKVTMILNGAVDLCASGLIASMPNIHPVSLFTGTVSIESMLKITLCCLVTGVVIDSLSTIYMKHIIQPEEHTDVKLPDDFTQNIRTGPMLLPEDALTTLRPNPFSDDTTEECTLPQHFIDGIRVGVEGIYDI